MNTAQRRKIKTNNNVLDKITKTYKRKRKICGNHLFNRERERAQFGCVILRKIDLKSSLFDESIRRRKNGDG